MKYFEMVFIRQKSKHPEGEGEIEILAEGKTKKEAVESAKEALADYDPENHEFYRVPVAKEITEEEYNAEDDEESEEEGNPEDNDTFYDDLDGEPEETTTSAAEQMREPEIEVLLFDEVPDIPVMIKVTSTWNEHKFNHTFIVKVVTEGNAYVDHSKAEGYTNFAACCNDAFEMVDDILVQNKSAHPKSIQQLDELLKVFGASDDAGFVGRHRSPIDFGLNKIAQAEKCVIELSSGEVIEKLSVDKDTEEKFKGLDDDFSFSDDDDEMNFDEPEGDAHLQVDIEEVIAESEPVALTVADVNAMIEELEPDGSFTLYDLPNDVYHGANGYSKSSLDIIAKDAGLLEWAKNAPEDEEKKATLDFGTAVHSCILEPDLYESDYAVMEKVNGATKEGKAYKAKFLADREQDGLEVLTAEEDKKIRLMSGSLKAHPKAAQLLKNGAAEVSIFWRDPETGIVFKIRCDWLTKLGDTPFIFDVKTCDNPELFEKSVAEYRYHVQDAFYSWVFESAMKVAPIFSFGVVGKHINCGKYPVRLLLLDPKDKLEGAAKCEEAIETLVECINTDRWGGFEIITRPAWAKKNDIT